MKIKLDPLEIIALQQVARNPGKSLNVVVSEMNDYGLVEPFEQGHQITNAGKLVLSRHLPVLMNGQNMKQPLGFNGLGKAFKPKA